MPINSHELYELELLQHVESDRKLNNRLVARKLNVSVRLAHDILKRMVEKGLVHVKVVHSRRWDYFLTPKGLLEKARLTLEYFEFSMYFYREARKRSAGVCKDLAKSGVKEVGILGVGDLAEITYLGTQEWELKLDSVFDDDTAAPVFMNTRIRPLNDLKHTKLPAIIVCLYNQKEPMEPRFLPSNIEPNDKFRWIF